MRRPNKPVYISDLDGTLLRSDGVLSEYSRKTLRRLLDGGLNFTVASARDVSEIRAALGDLPITLPVIAVNGAFLSDYAAGRHLIVNNLDAELAANILDRISGQNLWPFIRTFDGREDLLWFERITNPAMQWYHDVLALQKDSRLCNCDNLTEKLRETVISFSVMGEKEPIENLSNILSELFPAMLENFFFENPYSPGHWWLTIHDKKACKSIAIKELLDMTGFDRSQLTVFGDHINDIKMFKQAGAAIAVENADPRLKTHADVVIGSNDSDAVVKYIKKSAKSPKD